MIGIDELIKECEKEIMPIYEKIDDISLKNQEKVLKIFNENRISARHFASTNGYGYDDIGRDTLNKVFADIFHTESAIVSPNITCGSHALALALLGLLNKKGMSMLSITGKPYDTLDDVIFGTKEDDYSSFKAIGVEYNQIDLKDGYFDEEKIFKFLEKNVPTLIFLQRSRGYAWRNALCINDIKYIIEKIRKINTKSIIMVDNCYGEFTDICEPTEVGADITAGSLIKNLGGGLAPTGGYICGKEDLIKKISYRYTSPSLGLEVGSYAGSYQPFYQGLFMAAHTVAQAMKGSALMSCAMRKLGYKVLPIKDQVPRDIVTSIELNDKDLLIKLCQIIQEASPIDSFVVPEPWDMPGYNDPIIMSAGTFVQGATLEFSSDAPIRAPYILYVQGGLTLEHVKYGLKKCLELL